VIYIYGTRSCTFCDKAKQYAQKWYGEYKFLDIGIEKYYNILKEKNVSTYVLPQIFEDDEYIGTYYDFIKLNQYRMEKL
jgi:glutaredoxin